MENKLNSNLFHLGPEITFTWSQITPSLVILVNFFFSFIYMSVTPQMSFCACVVLKCLYFTFTFNKTVFRYNWYKKHIFIEYNLIWMHAYTQDSTTTINVMSINITFNSSLYIILFDCVCVCVW